MSVYVYLYMHAFTLVAKGHCSYVGTAFFPTLDMARLSELLLPLSFLAAFC